MTRAQLFHIWQLVQSAQAEVIEKKLRRFVEKRSARDFSATGDVDQAAFHQRLQHTVDVDTAHGFDIGTRDWLAIRDDGERLQRGRAQARGFRRGKQLAY